MDPYKLINQKVQKISGKPFKSTLKINTVKGVVINQQDPKNRLAFIFYEDDSIVNTDKCSSL